MADDEVVEPRVRLEAIHATDLAVSVQERAAQHFFDAIGKEIEIGISVETPDGGFEFWVVEFVGCGSQFLFKEKQVSACGDSFINAPFYKQIALGGGFGVRFDFSYFILRLDAGIRLRNPVILEENRGYWTDFSNNSFREVVNFNLRLGYPF